MTGSRHGTYGHDAPDPPYTPSFDTILRHGRRDARRRDRRLTARAVRRVCIAIMTPLLLIGGLGFAAHTVCADHSTNPVCRIL